MKPAFEIRDGLGFSRRYVDVIRLAALGHGPKQMGKELHISPRTATAHLRIIYQRLSMSGRGAMPKLTAWAINNGFGPGGPHARG